MVFYGCKQSRSQPSVVTIVTDSLRLTTTVYIARIQINEIIGMFAWMHNDIHYKPAPDLMSSFANTVLT